MENTCLKDPDKKNVQNEWKLVKLNGKGYVRTTQRNVSEKVKDERKRKYMNC